MIGREAYKSPLFIRLLDNYFLRRDEDLSQIRLEVVKKTIKYIKSCRIKNPNFKLNLKKEVFSENWIPPKREENALVNRRMNYLTNNE